MKSPWQLGFLALAVTGVSTYDYMYFKNYRSQKMASVQMAPDRLQPIDPAPLLAPLPETAASEQSGEATTGESRPVISPEELFRMARQTYVFKDDPYAGPDKSWPARDPFAVQEITEHSPVGLSGIPVKSATAESKPAPAPQLPAAPNCVFSGTFVQGNSRLALVDGTPLAIGERVGIWLLSKIEPDYILLEAGGETHRIALKNADLQTAGRKDPS